MHDDTLLAKLHQLSTQVASVGGLSILHQIDEKKSDLLARNSGFDLVEGGYYRAIAFDYLGNSKPVHYNLNATNSTIFKTSQIDNQEPNNANRTTQRN